MVDKIDYDKEGRVLLKRLHLREAEDPGTYRCLDPIWQESTVKGVGTLYVGDVSSAQTLYLLKELGITRMANCTRNNANYFEDESNSDTPCFRYLRFDIVEHRRRVVNHESAFEFVKPLLVFLARALREGRQVLIHCLAGAHRAGTTGVICLMYFGGLRRTDAIKLLRQRRPVVDIIGDFPILLSYFDDSFRKLRHVSLATTPWGLANCFFMKQGGLTEEDDIMLETYSLDY